MNGRNEAGGGQGNNSDGPRAIKTDHETSHLMSEPTTPSKGPTKRRSLALPPRGQALARLQDLERDSEGDGVPEPASTDERDKELSAPEGSNAVNTASSNAVQEAEIAGQMPASRTEAAPEVPTRPLPIREAVATAPETAAADLGRAVPVRAAREPTTRITVDMPDSLHRKISFLSVETRRSIKDLVIEALAATYFGAGTDRQ